MRTHNTVKLPLCADFESRKQVGPWKKSMGIAAEVEACLCGDIQAMLKQRDKERDKIMDKDWAQLRASNIKEAKRTKQEQRQADVANSRYITEPDPPQSRVCPAGGGVCEADAVSIIQPQPL